MEHFSDMKGPDIAVQTVVAVPDPSFAADSCFRSVSQLQTDCNRCIELEVFRSICIKQSMAEMSVVVPGQTRA